MLRAFFTSILLLVAAASSSGARADVGFAVAKTAAHNFKSERFNVTRDAGKAHQGEDTLDIDKQPVVSEGKPPQLQMPGDRSAPFALLNVPADPVVPTITRVDAQHNIFWRDCAPRAPPLPI